MHWHRASGSAGRRKEVLPHCWSTMHFMKFYKQNRENRVQSALKTAENALPRLWRVLERSVIPVPCQRPTNRRKTAELFDFECRPRGTFPSQSSGPQLQGWVVSFQYWSQRPDRSSDPDTWKANTSMSHRTLCKIVEKHQSGQASKVPKNPKCVWCLWCFQKKKVQVDGLHTSFGP